MSDVRCVWQKSHETVILIHKRTERFLKREQGLVWQIRRSSSSISFNIAEGCGRHTKKDQAHFLQIAFGSASETQCQLLLFRDLDFLEKEEAESLISDIVAIKKMLTKLIAYKRNGLK